MNIQTLVPPIYCCLHVFLGPSGTDQATPVAASDVSLADPPALKTNAADKADKQSMQKHPFFMKGNMLIYWIFYWQGFTLNLLSFFTGAALKNSRTVSCFMVYMTQVL